MKTNEILIFCFKKLVELNKDENVGKLHQCSDIEFEHGKFIKRYLEELVNIANKGNTITEKDLLELLIKMHPVIGDEKDYSGYFIEE